MEGGSNLEVWIVFDCIIRPIYWSFFEDNQTIVQVLNYLL